MDETTGDVSPEFLRLQIGKRVRQLRLAAKLTVNQTAKKLELSPSTVMRLEAGDSGVQLKERLVSHMLEVFGASDEDRGILMNAAAQTRNAKTTSWWHDYGGTTLQPWFVLLLTLEDAAETIRQYQSKVVPGLVQSHGYAEQILRTLGGVDPSEIDKRVNFRMKRQSLLTRARAPRLELVLDAAVLQWLVATGGALAHEQLQHLLDVSQQTNVDVRILPWTSGINGGIASTNGFSLLRFPTDPTTAEPIEVPLVYLENPTGAHYLTKPAEVEVFDLIWTDLDQLALDCNDSQLAIRTALKGLTA